MGETGTVRIDGTAVNRIDHWQFAQPHEDDKLVGDASYGIESVYCPGHPLYYENVIQTLREISMTMSFALLAGYRRIVLCGVDLANTAYFYHDPRHEARGLPVPSMLPATAEELARKYTQHGLKMSQVPDPSVHNTIDPALNPLPMDKVIHAFNEEVLKPEGVELYVALTSSKLFPRIPALIQVWLVQVKPMSAAEADP